MAVYAAQDELLELIDALACCAEPMFAINERHRVVFWNRALEQLLGWTYDEVVGRSCGQVLCGTDTFGNRYCTDPCPVIALSQRGEAIKHFGLVVRSRDGGSVPIDVNVIRFQLPQTKRPVLAHIVHPAQPQPAEVPPQPMRSSHTDARVRDLTAREMEVLGLVASGQSATDIAARLGISQLTARNHIQHVFEKIEVHSKSEAVAFAYRMHLV